jgi:hypothetical protein
MQHCLTLSVKSVRQPIVFFFHKNQLAILSASYIRLREQASGRVKKKKKIGRVERARSPQLVCISSASLQDLDGGALLGRLALPARHDFQITPARFPADTTRGSSSRRSLVRAHGAWPVRLRLLSSRRVMQKIGRNHLSCHAWPERPS